MALSLYESLGFACTFGKPLFGSLMLPRKYDSEVAPTWQRTVAGTVKRNGPLTHGLRSQNRGSKEWQTPCKVALPASARPTAAHHEDLRATTTGRLSLQEGSLTFCAPLHDRRATTGNRSREEQQISKFSKCYFF